ncbi:MAG: hypothetical protein QM535_02465 [Limnohabitans sp.]|nr:hypothetical protein [Limnohabitans sp.]
MKKIILLISIFTSFLTFSQENKISIEEHLNDSIIINADIYIGNDDLGFHYFINQNKLIKTNNNLKFEYQNISLGKITKVDLQNPLRVIVFYESFNTIIALDSQLNEIRKINFNEINSEILLGATGTASQNSYWIFNQLNQQLGIYNFQNNTFRYIGITFDKTIKNYWSTFNNFFWIDTDNNFFASDIFGKKSYLGKIPSFDTISSSDDDFLIYEKDKTLTLFNFKKKISYPIEIVQKSFLSFHYKNQNLAIFTTEGLTNYKINLP